MEKLFESALFTRESLLKIMDELTMDQLLCIPDGFKNSIFWNIAHLLVSQQLLIYGLSGKPLLIEEDFVKRYRKGTMASLNVTNEDMEFVRENLVKLHKQTKYDFEHGTFLEYAPYMTSANINLVSIEDAITFSTYHDGIHLGVVLSLKKLV